MTSATQGRGQEIFISYAHADGVRLARRLETELRSNGYRVWFDSRSLEGGMRWAQELEEALRSCSVVLALFSTASNRSNFCTSEHLRALRDNKHVIPIRVLPEATPPLYFEYLQHVDFSNELRFSEDFTSLLASLQGSSTSRLPGRYEKTKVTAESMPVKSIARVAQMERLKALLLSEGAAPVPLVSITGITGIGKTWLAQSLCGDDMIRAAFPDGIVWRALGRSPDLVARMREVGDALGDAGEKYTTLESAKIQLRTFLRDKAVLIVLDDVSEVEHLEAFRVDEPRCRILFTSRNRLLVAWEGAEECELQRMSTTESVDLLTLYAGPEYPGAADPALPRIAERLGNLPFALRIAGSVLRTRISGEELLQSIDRSYATWHSELGTPLLPEPLPGLEPFLDEILDTLPSETKRFYYHLGVLPRHSEAPTEVALKLWVVLNPNHDSPGGIQALQDFNRLGLMEWASSPSTGRKTHERISLHEILHLYARKKLGAKAPEAHRTLMGALNPKLKDWWDVDDLYLNRYLAYHMARGEKHPELRTLLLDPRWIEMKLRKTGPTSLILDYKPLVENDPDLALVEGAIRLSENVLAEEPEELASQLRARLLSSNSPAIVSLLEQVALRCRKPWLRPMVRSLTSPGGPLRATLLGHTDQVNGVAVSTSGEEAFSVSDDGTLRVWNLASGQPVGPPISAHDTGIKAVATTWGLVVTGADDGLIRVWDQHSRVLRHSLAGHGRPVKAIAISQSGQLLSGGDDHSVRIWEPHSGRLLRTLIGHRARVRAVLPGRTADEAFSGSDDGTIIRWDTVQGAPVRVFQCFGTAVWGLAMLTNPARLIAASWDSTLWIWRLDEDAPPEKLEGHKNGVTAVIALDSDRIASGAADDDIIVWSVNRRELLCTLSEHTQWLRGLSKTPDGRLLISASGDHSLKVWDMAKISTVMAPRAHSQRVNCVSVADQEKRVVSGSADKTLKVWNLDQPITILNGHTKPIVALAVTFDGKTVISCSEDLSVRLWQTDGESEPKLLTDFGKVSSVKIAGDGSVAVLASADRSLYLWELKAGHTRPAPLGEYDGGITCLALTKNGRWAIVASADGMLTKIDLHDRSEIKIGSLKEIVRSMDVSDDGQLLLIGTGDGRIVLWDVTSNTRKGEMSGHTDEVSSIAFVDATRQAVSASADKTLKLWDLRARKAAAVFHSGERLLACAAGGVPPLVVAGGEAGALHIFDVQELGIAAKAS